MSGKGATSPSECLAFNRDVANALRETRNATVFLAAYWSNLFTVGYFPANVGDKLDEGLGRTLALLQEINAHAVLIQDEPRQPVSIADARNEARLLRRPLSQSIVVGRAIAEAQQAWIDPRFRRAEADGRATYLRTFDVFCGSEQCLAERDGEELYFDDNHLSPAGTMLLRGLLEPVLANLEKGAPFRPPASRARPLGSCERVRTRADMSRWTVSSRRSRHSFAELGARRDGGATQQRAGAISPC